jgi:hypothetical protein
MIPPGLADQNCFAGVSSEPTVELNGLFSPDFRPAERVRVDVRQAPPAGLFGTNPTLFEVKDARLLQRLSQSTAAFFEFHGFVLLLHRTVVQDWERATHLSEGSELTQLYYGEIELLIHQHLFPGKRVEILQWGPPVRRGRDTPNPEYINAVHSDYGVTSEDFEVNVEAYADGELAHRWRRTYERDEVEAFLQIDFWRPTAMTEPLRHMPLAFCDPTSVEIADLVPVEMMGVAPSERAARHVGLRYNPTQRWYYYPRMRTDEVLAFKLFECWKEDPEPGRFRSIFHTAFAEPDAPADAELRQSCEHRVGVFVLRE